LGDTKKDAIETPYLHQSKHKKFITYFPQPHLPGFSSNY
jgi:hypothetical protein